jgi:hypothetical protein
MLRHIFTAVLRRRKPHYNRRTDARISNALGCDAELMCFVPEAWIPSHGYEHLPDQFWQRGVSLMQPFAERPPQTPPSAETETTDEKVVRLIPRPVPQRLPDLPDEDDNDDPGPAAA